MHVTRYRPVTKIYTLLLAALVFGCSRSGAAAEISPPAQPSAGYGSSEYAYQRVLTESHGAAADQYWIFKPADGHGPTLPVVVFLHGWGAMNPKYYGAWIEHLVRRGHTVVYPRYQESLRTPPAEFTDHALGAVRDAFTRIGGKPAWVVMGHSMGGVISANLAARANRTAIGAPLLVLSVEPGKTWGARPRALIAFEDLASLPPSTVLVAVAGDHDTLVKDVDARNIFSRVTGIPPARKRYIVVRSDDHGTPAIDATHRAPVAPDDAFDLLPQATGFLAERGAAREASMDTNERTVSAIDYFAFWKLADALIAFAPSAEPFSAANERVLADMGKWSDGQQVAPLRLYSTLP